MHANLTHHAPIGLHVEYRPAIVLVVTPRPIGLIVILGVIVILSIVMLGLIVTLGFIPGITHTIPGRTKM
jgi:hypothetical protein